MADDPDEPAPEPEPTPGEDDDEPRGPGPRVIVREYTPGPAVSRSTGDTSADEARRTGLTVSCALTFPARRSELGQFDGQLRARPVGDRERLGGTPPGRAGASTEAAVNVRVTIGEQRVRSGSDGKIVVIDDSANDDT